MDWSGIRLTSFPTKNGIKTTWFNPRSDILYFGKETCIRTVMALLESSIKFARVAMDAAEVNTHGCRFCDRVVARNPSLAPFLGTNLDYVTRMLRLLHGFTPAGNGSNMFPGCKNFQDLTLFMKEAGPWDHAINSDRACAGFKAYTKPKTYFPLVGQYRVSSEQYVQHLMESTLAPLEKKLWTKNKQPSIQLVRCTQALLPGDVFEMMVLRIPGAGQHRMLWYSVTSKCDKGIHCGIWPPEYSGPGDYVFKFMGRKSGVDFVLNILTAAFDKVEAFFKTKVAIIDVAEAAFPTSKTIPTRERTDMERYF